MSASRNGERRPSPEALLAGSGNRGRLKIFLGAAPGVGKTYEMLVNAQARRREGVDVVIGVVETHGRQETGALLQGLEVMPRRVLDYKGRQLTEMDLDAILARHPQLVLVDELAHSNAPGSRHPKRYLDVEELLSASINVYCTLNIQHVESLNDVVARITRIRVRETVPDSIIDLADEIELVDLTPEDLIQRLHEGKVYVPSQAQRRGRAFLPARQSHCAPRARAAPHRPARGRPDGRRTCAAARSTDRGRPASACWSASAMTEAAWRAYAYGRRMADTMRAPWAALHVETTAEARFSEAERDRVAEALRLGPAPRRRAGDRAGA